MGFIWAVVKLGLLGGGISSIVLPSLMAAGYKDFEGHGYSNRSNGGIDGGTGVRPTNWKNYDNEAKRIGESNGIHVGRIPGQTKISGKMKNKCSNNGENFTLGSQTGQVGRKNGGKNKKLYGEIEFTCNNSQKHTLFLKGDDETSSKKGGYGRVK